MVQLNVVKIKIRDVQLNAKYNGNRRPVGSTQHQRTCR